MTRARKLVIVVGGQRAIELAVNQVKDQGRHTLLASRLMNEQRLRAIST